MLVWSSEMIARTAIVLLGLQVLTQPPVFEQASVKLSRLDRVSSVGDGIIRIYPGRFHASAGLVPLIAKAYDTPAPFIFGGPGWIDSQSFDINAKTDVSAEEAQVKLMLQTLLAERLRLKMHRETKNLPVSSLTLGRATPKLTAAADGGVPSIRIGPRAIMGHKVSMAYLAAYLTRRMGELVLDNTGLEGEFDFSVDVLPGGREMQNDPLTLPWKLGLNVETRKSPVETLVIDHVEKPSAN
jgi:uncharacterized protein (TIGR03435 family)